MLEPTRKPIILIVGEGSYYRQNLRRWLLPYCDMVFARRPKDAEHFFKIRSVDVFLVLENKEVAIDLRQMFPLSLICLLTEEAISISPEFNIKNMQPPKNKSTTNVSVLGLWQTHADKEEREGAILKHLDLVQLDYIEPQEQLDAIHMRLTRVPHATIVGVSLRHDYSPNRANLCAALMYGCPGGCSFCGSARLKPVPLTEDELAAQIPMLITAPKSLGHDDLTIAWHGGGDPMYCTRQLCGGIRKIEHVYNLNARYLVTSAGKVATYRQMFDELSDYDISYEVSGNFTEMKWRHALMRLTRDCEPLEVITDLLSEHAIKTGKRNKYRVMVVKGVNDSEKEADRIAYLLRDKYLSVVVTVMLPDCLPGFQNATNADGERVVGYLKDRGIDAYFIPNKGTGLVSCGRHVSVRDRALFYGFKSRENFANSSLLECA